MPLLSVLALGCGGGMGTPELDAGVSAEGCGEGEAELSAGGPGQASLCVPRVSLAVGSRHACEASADGEVSCEGDNSFGQSRPPSLVRPIVALAAAWNHTCALDDSGSVSCWGGQDAAQRTPPEFESRVVRLAAGARRTCARTEEGAWTCWGATLEAERAISPTATELALGARFSCALSEDGEVSCGSEDGLGEMSPPESLSEVTAIAAGARHACALDAAGRVTCWGNDQFGQASPPEDLAPAVQIAAGRVNTCAIDELGAARCWGDDSHQQRTPVEPYSCTADGDGSTVTCSDGASWSWAEASSILLDQCVPWSRLGCLRRLQGAAVNIGVGAEMACAVRDDGERFCWGGRRYLDRVVRVALAEDVVLSGGRSHSCGIDAEGAVVCIGPAVGDPPSDFGRATAVASGEGFTCAINERQELACWGREWAPLVVPGELGPVHALWLESFQLCAVHGEGRLSCFSEALDFRTLDPALLGIEIETCTELGEADWVCPSVSDPPEAWTCSLTDLGELECTGRVPSPLAALTPIAAIAGDVSGNAFCALDASGWLTCVGVNQAPPPPGEFVHVSVGFAHACARDPSGQMRCWGTVQSWGDD